MQPENIPHELRNWQQWVCHGADKKPLNAHTGLPASVADPKSWASFEEACEAVVAGKGVGVGFVLTKDDPFAFIDLDVKPGEQPTAEQQGILARFDSYAEYSPSGRGLHIICKGEVPSGRRCGNVEVYSSGRYMTTTGNVFREVPIAQCDLAPLWQHLGSASSGVPNGSDIASVHDPVPAPIVRDERLVELICRARSNSDNYYGNNITDWSASYFALICAACRFSSDPKQVRRVVMASPLVENSPVSETGEARQHKAARLWVSEYARAATRGAQERQQEAQEATRGAQLAARIASIKPNGALPFDKPRRNVLELRATYRNVPLPGFIVEGWIPEDDVTLWTGDGGIGKTEATLQTGLRICAQAGHMPFTVNTSAPVLFWSAEDGEQRINTKIDAICTSSHVQLGGAWFDERLSRFTVRDISGCHLWEVDKNTPAGKPTLALLALHQDIAETGGKILFIDNIAIVCQFNLSDPIPVTAFISFLRKVAAETRCAIVLLGHVSADSAVGTTRKSFFGTQAWHNAVRSRLFMEKIAENGDIPEHIRVSHEKSNYGPIMEPFRLRRNTQTGILTPFTNHDVATAIDESFTPLVEKIFSHIQEAQSRNDPIRAATAGPRTSFHCLVGMFPQHYSESDKITKKRVRLGIARLAEQGRIVKRNGRTVDRNGFEYWAVLPTDDPLYGKGI